MNSQLHRFWAFNSNTQYMLNADTYRSGQKKLNDGVENIDQIHAQFSLQRTKYISSSKIAGSLHSPASTYISTLLKTALNIHLQVAVHKI